MFKSLGLALCLVSLNSLAHTTYVGAEKKTKDACFLTIENSYYEGEETKNNLRIDVMISLKDGHSSHQEVFHLTLKPGLTADLYTALATNGKDQLNVFSSSTESLIPTMYAFKWLHGSHFHSAQCLNLAQDNHSHE